MPESKDLTLTLHGLDEFNHAVDAEVFASKFSAFMKGLASADIAANGSRRHKYLVSDLVKNTATAKVREQLVVTGANPDSGINYYATGIGYILSRSPQRRLLPDGIIKSAVVLGRDVGKIFKFAELKLGDKPIAIINGDFWTCAIEAQKIKANDNAALANRFTGTAFGSFDGILEMVDLRHGSKKAVLTLTAGGLEIQCDTSAMNSDEEVHPTLGHRAIVYGLAHYDGVSALPRTLEIRKIDVHKSDADLVRWKQFFSIEDEADEEDDWA
jgi:hypothetical protein